MSRVCCVCGVSQPRDNFTKDKGRRDGLDPRCIQCARAKDRARAKKTEYKLRRAAEEAKHRLKYPEKYKARVQARRIPLANACEACGVESAKLHRHHPDYSKPLDVVTLCIDCHEDTHHRITV